MMKNNFIKKLQYKKYLCRIGISIFSIVAGIVIVIFSNSYYQSYQEKIIFNSEHLHLTVEEINNAHRKAKNSNNLYVLEAMKSVEKYRNALFKDATFLNKIAKMKYKEMNQEKKSQLRESIKQDAMYLKTFFEYIKNNQYSYEDEISDYKMLPIQVHGSLIKIFVDDVNSNFDKYIDILMNFNLDAKNIFGIWSADNNNDLSIKLYLPALFYLSAKVISVYDDKPFYQNSEISNYYSNDIIKNSAVFHAVDFVPYNSIALNKNIPVDSDFRKHFIVTRNNKISLIYPHSGYVFGGTHGDSLFYDNIKDKFLSPHDCSTWVSTLLKLPKTISTYHAFSLKNYINNTGLFNVSMIDNYLHNQKAFDRADFNIIEVKKKEDLQVGDILFIRKFANNSFIKYFGTYIHTSGHVGVIIDIIDNKKNIILLSYTREYDNGMKDLALKEDKAGGFMFQKENIEQHLNDFSDQYKYLVFRKKDFNNIVVHNQGEYNCNLDFKGKRYRCSYGLNGFTDNKVEGDVKTPVGTFSLGDVYYRENSFLKKEDILSLNRRGKKTFSIKENAGWGGDKDNYNQYIEFNNNNEDFKNAANNNLNDVGNSERLWRPNDNLYDVVVPIGYNQDNIFGKGSAIFFHIAREGYSPTGGCIAVNIQDMKDILSRIASNTKIIIIR